MHGLFISLHQAALVLPDKYLINMKQIESYFQILFQKFEQGILAIKTFLKQNNNQKKKKVNFKLTVYFCLPFFKSSIRPIIYFFNLKSNVGIVLEILKL